MSEYPFPGGELIALFVEIPGDGDTPARSEPITTSEQYEELLYGDIERLSHLYGVWRLPRWSPRRSL